MNHRLGTILAMTALWAGPSAAQAQDIDIEQGRALAVTECGECHATGTADDSPMVEAPPFRTLGELYPVESLEEALAEGIVTGHADMPEVIWEPVEIADFLAWLATIQR